MAFAALEARRFDRCPAARPAGRRSGHAVRQAPPVEPGEQLGDLGRRVLPVAVQRADHRPRAKLTPLWIAADCPALSPCWTSRRNGNRSAQRQHPCGGAVGRAVVDVDQLEGADPGAGGGDPLGDEGEVLGLVLQRNDDRQPGQGRVVRLAATCLPSAGAPRRNSGRATPPSRTLVGVRGFEPPTPCSRSRCATRLRYTPNRAGIYAEGYPSSRPLVPGRCRGRAGGRLNAPVPSPSRSGSAPARSPAQSPHAAAGRRWSCRAGPRTA